MKKRFNIIAKAEKLTGYAFTATNKSPKKLRCDFVPELRNGAMTILKGVIRANRRDLTGPRSSGETRAKRRALQEDCLDDLRILDSLAEMALEHGYLTNKQFDYLTLLSQELYDMILKWIESDAKRA